MAQAERVPFRLLNMECCGHQLCWVNPRFPSYCPECGIHVYPEVRSWAVEGREAELKIYDKPIGEDHEAN